MRSTLASWAFMRLPAISHPLAFHAHLACAARDDFHRGVDVVTVEIGHLDLGDLLQLLARELADLLFKRIAAAGLETERLLDQHRRRRRLGDEGKADRKSTRLNSS